MGSGIADLGTLKLAHEYTAQIIENDNYRDWKMMEAPKTGSRLANDIFIISITGGGLGL